jgi:hypothetical protein
MIKVSGNFKLMCHTVMKNSKKERILKLIRQKKTIMQEKRKLAPVKVNWKAGAYGINIAGSEGEP